MLLALDVTANCFSIIASFMTIRFLLKQQKASLKD